MALSKADKELIKEEFRSLTIEQDKALNALKQTGLELKVQFAESLAAYQNRAQELRFHLYGLRILWVVILLTLGGGIYGILQFPRYLDSQIDARSAKSDRVNLA